jgi:acyl dehydratase
MTMDPHDRSSTVPARATTSLAQVPLDERHFEDYTAGSVVDCGSVRITEADILDFGRRFDPQPFHANPEAAATGPFGGVIASGWHTGSLMMRQFVDHYISSTASLGSPGAQELTWPSPVRAGDTLSVSISVTDARKSRTKPDRGLVHSHITVTNQKGEAVMTMKVVNFLRCRTAS